MARDAWLGIVNPVAGRGAGAKLAGTLAATFAEVGLRVDIARSQGPGECARLAAAAVDDGYQVILSVGGDGTANDIANGMLGSAAALALYPIGTGNDLARKLALLRLYRGTHVDGVRIRGIRGREIDIELDRSLPMEMDGEVSRVRALSIRVNPRGLRVLA